MSSFLTSRHLLPAALALVLASGGCALKKDASALPKTGFFVVSSHAAEFFKYGPAQSFGPDFMLKKGERVTMLNRDWGFSRVLTENGVAGYVATEDIEPAPPAPAPAPRIASTRSSAVPIGHSRGGSSPRVRRENPEFLGNPNDPLFNVNDVPLPMPDEAPAKLKPEFRAAPPSRDAAPEPKAKTTPKFRG